MKKLIVIGTIAIAFIDTVFEMKILENMGFSVKTVGIIKLIGILISTILAYYIPRPKEEGFSRRIGGTRPPIDKDEK
jgi:hypothetical protein